MKKYQASLIMLALALVAIVFHYWFGWQDFKGEQAIHGEPALVGEYLNHYFSTFFENIQSELLQLAVQFAVLAGAFKMKVFEKTEEPDNEKMKLDLAELKSDMSEIKTTLAGMVNK
jgi:hypothetical protein